MTDYDLFYDSPQDAFIVIAKGYDGYWYHYGVTLADFDRAQAILADLRRH